MTPFSWRPMNSPFRKNSPPCRIPSNSRKTFLSAMPAGSRNLFRYHATPVGRSWMLTLKAESSFQACGSVTFFQSESLKAGASAPFGSPTRSFQSQLKLYFRSRAQRRIKRSAHASQTRKAEQPQNQSDYNY